VEELRGALRCEHRVVDASSPDGPWTDRALLLDAKVAALEQALEGAEAWVTGIRREQGPTRAATELVELDEVRGLLKYNPLAHWTDQDLWRRIHERDLPYHPLHDRGYDSIGCARAPFLEPAARAAGRGRRRPSAVCTSSPSDMSVAHPPS